MRKQKIFGLRVPEEMREFIKEQAEQNGRSQNKQIEMWIKEKMNEQNKAA